MDLYARVRNDLYPARKMACLVTDLIATIATYTTFQVTTHLFTVAPHLAYQKKLWMDKAKWEARDALVDANLIEPGGWPRYYLQVNRTFYGRIISTDPYADMTQYNAVAAVFIGSGEGYIWGPRTKASTRIFAH